MKRLSLYTGVCTRCTDFAFRPQGPQFHVRCTVRCTDVAFRPQGPQFDPDAANI